VREGTYEGGTWILNGKKFDRPSSSGSGNGVRDMLNIYFAGLLFLIKKSFSSNMD
jgi:hypothetical protein